MPSEPCYGWREVSGYFDADGTVHFDLKKRVLFPRLSFSDNYRPQIDMVKEFLVSQNVRPWNTYFDTSHAWKFGVSRGDSLHIMASMMLPYIYKKKDEVEAVLDYLDNRITGSEFVEVLNESVRIGNRVGKVKTVDMPHTREEGQILRDRKRTEHAYKMITANTILTVDLIDKIRESLLSGEATNGELAKKYGVSPATISRAMYGRSDRE